MGVITGVIPSAPRIITQIRSTSEQTPVGGMSTADKYRLLLLHSLPVTNLLCWEHLSKFSHLRRPARYTIKQF
ncbi:hypothetical protein RRG08_040267 [Elysia crispata]|uniref:Uncharacterized protein n=1 Tax=Elysia crispata TaxID=231223 RepID=A0AAE0YAJ6_9GAST|nr:hypothetical protein RRG08_040267 [Elysia crispata]